MSSLHVVSYPFPNRVMSDRQELFITNNQKGVLVRNTETTLVFEPGFGLDEINDLRCFVKLVSVHVYDDPWMFEVWP